MQTRLVLARTGTAVVALMALVTLAQGRPLAGLWDREIKYDDLTVEFPMEFSGSASDVKGSFFNGDERVASTSSIQTGNSLVLDFGDYATQLRVTEEPGVLKGTYGNKLQGVHETSELAAKIPQAERLNAWPTTFFIGRDGRVRTIHTGFAAPASGAFHTQLRQEFAGTVERLLAE
jgi:hypothetical protein